MLDRAMNWRKTQLSSVSRNIPTATCRNESFSNDLIPCARENTPKTESRSVNSCVVGLPVKFLLNLVDQPHFRRASARTYPTAKSLSKSSLDSLAPSSDNHTDLFFVAGSEM